MDKRKKIFPVSSWFRLWEAIFSLTNFNASIKTSWPFQEVNLPGKSINGFDLSIDNSLLRENDLYELHEKLKEISKGFKRQNN